MNEVKNNCPNCGANISIPGENIESSAYTCPYCGTLLRIKPEHDVSESGFTDSSHIHWKIEIFENSHFLKTSSSFPGKKLAFLPLLLLPFIVYTVISKSLPFRGIFSSDEIVCSGVERVSIVNREISSVDASDNCRVVLNNVQINSDSPAVKAKDYADITIVNSEIKTGKTAIRANDNAKISIVNSSIRSDTTVFNAGGNALIKLTSSTAVGKENLFIREKNARIDSHNSTVKGKRVKL